MSAIFGKPSLLPYRQIAMSFRPRLNVPAGVVALLVCAFSVDAQIVPNRYTVTLEDPPSAGQFATREDLRSTAAAAYSRRIETRQAEITRNLEGRGIHVTGSASMLVNALFVTASSSRVAEIEAIP